MKTLPLAAVLLCASLAPALAATDNDEASKLRAGRNYTLRHIQTRSERSGRVASTSSAADNNADQLNQQELAKLTR